jgi:hypothetical protein
MIIYSVYDWQNLPDDAPVRIKGVLIDYQKNHNHGVLTKLGLKISGYDNLFGATVLKEAYLDSMVAIHFKKSLRVAVNIRREDMAELNSGEIIRSYGLIVNNRKVHSVAEDVRLEWILFILNMPLCALFCILASILYILDGG